MDITILPNGNFSLATGPRTRLEIPVTAGGAAAIAKILTARARAEAANERVRIGTPEYPVQAAMDAWLMADRAARKRATEKEATEELDKLETKYGIKTSDLFIDL